MRRTMSQHGASLQNYNQKLVKCLEDLKIKKKEIQEILAKEEMEKAAIENQIRALTEKLEALNANLQTHRILYDNYERTVNETELGFKKILESSHMLLNLAQQEASKLHTYNANSSCNILNEECYNASSQL